MPGTTTLEATGGQTSVEYDLLDRSSQEAIFEIYQQLQDGGDADLLEKYEGMVSKIIREMNTFNKEKSELEQTLRSEKQKYNAYLANLENDVEMQIKDVEHNVKQELNDKHQRELDLLRKQMEAKMAELHENMMKFNEESAKAASTSAAAVRRGSVAPNELVSMRNQVSELADQSQTLRSELLAAQEALASYRLQVQELVEQQQQHQAFLSTVPDRHLTLDVGGSRTPRSRSYVNMAQLDPSVGIDENSTTSRRSSRYSNFGTGDMGGNGGRYILSPSGGEDSGRDSMAWTVGGKSPRQNIADPSRMSSYAIDELEGINLAVALAQQANSKNVDQHNSLAAMLAGTDYQSNTGEITPPEFIDPNNLPEHVQFKLERFQKSLQMAAENGGNHAETPSSEGRNLDSLSGGQHRPLAPVTSDPSGNSLNSSNSGGKRPASHIGTKQLSINAATSPTNSSHLFRKATTAGSSRNSVTARYGQNTGAIDSPASIPKSRGAIPIGSNHSGSGNVRVQQYLSASTLAASGRAGSMNSIYQSNAQANEQKVNGSGLRSTSSFGDEINQPVRQGSVYTENSTVFGYETDRSNNDMVTVNVSNNEVVSTVALEPERVFRVVLAGDSAVGKSSLLMRLVEDRFVSNLPTTLGVDFFTRLFQIDEDERRTVALQLWDTAGQERFRSLARSYFRRADGVLLVYDITSEKTFLSVRDWISIVRESSDSEVSIMICANKNDLRPFCAAKNMRTVSRADGQQLAEAYNTLFVETSAKSGEGIVDGITELIRLMRNREDVSMRTAGLHLDEHANKVTTFRCNPIGASASVKRPTCS